MSISESEFIVMDILWRESPLTSEDIIACATQTQDWGTSTVKTLINRLLKKKVVSAEKDGRRYLYSPLVERADYVDQKSDDLVDRLFGGRVAPLVTHFSERQKLTSDDIADLKRLIAELEDDG